LNKNTLYSISL